MKVAIQQHFPSSVHRLCRWHLSRNATSNIKSPNFTKAFRKLLYKNYNFPQWYDRWNALFQNFDLHSNASVNATYETRGQWAETFVQNNFFRGMSTTQQCESMNSYLKRFVPCKLPFREFIRHIDVALRNIKEVERYDDYISKNTKQGYLSLSPLLPYLSLLGSVLTRQVYHMVRMEIEIESSYTIISNECLDNSNVYKVKKIFVKDYLYSVT
ncbi:hypothetical protein UlMin_032310 [Ulmus minor]